MSEDFVVANEVVLNRFSVTIRPSFTRLRPEHQPSEHAIRENLAEHRSQSRLEPDSQLRVEGQQFHDATPSTPSRNTKYDGHAENHWC